MYFSFEEKKKFDQKLVGKYDKIRYQSRVLEILIMKIFSLGKYDSIFMRYFTFKL